MLNHRIVTILFAISIGLVFIFCELASPCFYVFQLALLLIYVIIQFLGAYFIGLNFHLTSLNSLQQDENKIALTFDDGPDPKNTPLVLDALLKHQVKATFFVIGNKIKGNEQVLKRIVEEGHAIGSHSYSHHFWIDLWGIKKLEADIKKSLDIIKAITNQDTVLFRPPYGVTTPNFAIVLKKLQLKSIGWNVRSYDTSISDINKIFDKVMSQTKNGSVILLHDRLDFMPELLNKLIPALKSRNFEFVPLNS